MKVETKEKMIDHPLEQLFGIESGTTLVEYKEFVPDPIVESPAYDNKDDEIDSKLETIYTTAMSQVVAVSDEIESVEGKYKARIGEVAATMLNVALGAVREKRMMKEHKDKLSPHLKVSDAKNITNNNLVVADRNEILKMIRNPQNIE